MLFCAYHYDAYTPATIPLPAPPPREAEDFFQKRTNMKIYKYYAPRDYNFLAFCRNQIFFSKPSNLNDPFDTSELLIKPYKKFCNAIKWNSNKKSILNNHAICSFSEGEDANNRHLWSLYADNYAGYALEFDRDILSDKLAKTYITPIYLQQVVYNDVPFDLDNQSNGFVLNNESYQLKDLYREFDPKLLDRLFQYLHLYKDKLIWQNENEWRLIIGNLRKNRHLHAKENGYLLDLLPNTIKSITIGYKMNDCDRCMLINCAKCKGIPIFEARPNIINNRWDVEIKKIL